MGQVVSSREKIVSSVLIGGFLGGVLWTGLRWWRISKSVRLELPHDSSFLSMESNETANELDFELEQQAQIIKSIKDLMQEGNETGKKRQLEESLMKAEMSFRDLFELKSRIGDEIAKSAAIRSSASKVILGGFEGDCSPFKRQRRAD